MLEKEGREFRKKEPDMQQKKASVARAERAGESGVGWGWRAGWRPDHV